MNVTIEDWIALVGVLVGALALLLSILVAVWSRRDRLLEARRALYAELWIACDYHKREVEAQVNWRLSSGAFRGDKDPGIGSSEPARRAYIAVTLVSRGNVVKLAEVFYGATARLGRDFAYQAGAYPAPLDKVAWEQALHDWEAAAEAFHAAAGEDVGKPR